jgi:hypothetical protein
MSSTKRRNIHAQPTKFILGKAKRHALSAPPPKRQPIPIKQKVALDAAR